MWLELIVIVERKAHINMQQTERDRGRGRGRRKKSELSCRNMRLITEQQSNVASGTQLSARAACKEMLIISKIKINEIGHKNSMAPLANHLTPPSTWLGNSGVGAVCILVNLVEVSANVCHIIDDDCHRNSLVFSTF